MIPLYHELYGITDCGPDELQGSIALCRRGSGSPAQCRSRTKIASQPGQIMSLPEIDA
jgi:hypothetical protein